MSEYGWTKAEFDAAPEAITRLHKRILDLEDHVAELEEIVDSLQTENEQLRDDLTEMSEYLEGS